MLIFGSFTKKTIKSYDFICNSHKKVNKKEFIRTGRNKKRQSPHRGFYTHRNSALSKRRRPTLPLAQYHRRGGA